VNYSVKNPVPRAVSSWVSAPPPAGDVENVDEEPLGVWQLRFGRVR
jgi:hypothetical protein